MANVQAGDIKEKDIQNCEHTTLSKEYYLGSATGDYVYNKCGKVGFGSDWPSKLKKQKDSSE